MSKNYQQSFEPGCFYHVYNRGNNRIKIFYQKRNYSYFLSKLDLLILPFFDIIAYCLIPNHFHLLIRAKPEDECFFEKAHLQGTVKSRRYLQKEIGYNQLLEDQFRRLFSTYAMAINKQEKRTGSLFQKRFKRVGLKDNNSVINVLLYIHHNPIHYYLASDYKMWKHSSYCNYLNLIPLGENHQLLLSYFQEVSWEKAKEKYIQLHMDYAQEYKSRNLP